MGFMKKLIIKLYYNDVIRYIFFGGLATLVNLVSFFILYKCLHLELNLSNVIAISLAIIFAYFTNATFVFHSEASGFKEKVYEFVKFVGARIFSMGVEIGGVFLMVKVLKWDGMISKILIQVVVMILNYVFSKVIVFVKKKEEKN
jgi:putative flippase GtrA